jgi:methyl-accepting chemotaxis protein
LRIGQRLLLGSSLPLLLFVAFAGWLWLALGQAREDAQVHLTLQVELALLAKDMQRDVVQVQQFLSDVSATRGLDGLDDGFALAQQSRDDFLRGLDRFRTLTRDLADTGLRAELATIESDFSAYYQAGTAMAQAYVNGGPATGNPLMAGFDRSSTKLQQDMDELVKRAVGALQEEVAAISADLQTLRLLAIALCVLVIALSFAVSAWVGRSIVRPLGQAVASLERVAAGDLTVTVVAHGRDEVADLMRALCNMQQQLRDLCGGVLRGAEMVASSSEQIARDNLDLSARTEEQASAVQQTAASVTDLSQTVRLNAESIEQANRLTQSAAQISQQAATVVREMVDTMQGVHTSSRRIGEIIGVIDGIAFQTNILALNASVESARAGEQGRGFAVVASEVRSLAGRSAESSRQIRQLIDTSVKEVEASAALVERAGQAMQEVATSIQGVTGIMSVIAASAHHQGAGLTEVDQSVRQIDEATQQNSTMVEEVATAAAQLKEQAVELLQQARVFRLDAGGAAA